MICPIFSKIACTSLEIEEWLNQTVKKGSPRTAPALELLAVKKYSGNSWPYELAQNCDIKITFDFIPFFQSI